jgi:hypothetical protein
MDAPDLDFKMTILLDINLDPPGRYLTAEQDPPHVLSFTMQMLQGAAVEFENELSMQLAISNAMRGILCVLVKKVNESNHESPP